MQTFGVGGFLVILGLCFVAIDLLLSRTAHPASAPARGFGGVFLSIGVLLIGIGVLLGHNVAVTSK